MNTIKLKEQMKQWIIPVTLGAIVAVLNAVTQCKYDKLIISIICAIGALFGFFVARKASKENQVNLMLILSLGSIGLLSLSVYKGIQFFSTFV